MAKPSSEKHCKQSSVEGISELLRCYICMDRLTDASVCPNCSKLGCYACIRQWVTKNKQNCPHCRQPLAVRDLIKIPLFDDLGQILDTLRATPQATARSGNQERDKCPTHTQHKFSVYCESCKKCICHECALWGEHTGHTFKPIEFLFERQKELCLAEKAKLNDVMHVVVNQLQQVEKRMESIKAGKQRTKRDVNLAVERILCRLDDQCKAKLHKLGECKQSLKTRAVDVTNLSCRLEEEMNGRCISSLMNGHGQLKPDVVETLQKLSTEPDAIPTVHEFINEIVPTYECALFKVHPFRDLQIQGEAIYSKPLSVFGMRWRLKVYPNGHRDDTGRYLGVFVELQDGFDKTSSYQYCIEMLFQCTSRYPRSNFKKEYVSDFAEGESWGYGKFYKLNKLQEDGFLRENTLVLKFSVRALTYHQKAEDLVYHVDHLQNQLSSLREKNQTLQQQVIALKNEQSRSGHSRGSPIGSSSRSAATPSSGDHPHTQQLAPPQAHHHHSYSAPAPQEHLHGRERERSRDRLEPEDVRRAYTSASQQPLRTPSHRQGPHSPKRSPYLTQPGQNQSTHFTATEPLPVAAYGRRRRSHGDPDVRQQLADHRRNSAESTASGHPYRSHALPRSLSQSHQELHHTHNLEEGARHSRGRIPFHDQIPPSSSRYSRSRERRATSMRVPHEPGNPPASVDSLVRSSNFRTFEDSSSETEDGSSQPWEVNPADIHITVEDESSTASTLVSQQRMPGLGAVGSQELFDDDTEIMSLSTLAEGIPMSSQPQYYGHFEQEPVLTRHDSHQGLSQPSVPLRSKHGRHRMSLSDLSSLGNSTTNLTHSQYLSQSVVEVPRYAHRGDMPGHRFPENHPKHTQSYSHGYLNRLPSDPHFNPADGPPGQQRSILGAMIRLQEELKQTKRNQHHHHHKPGAHSSPTSFPRSQPSQRRQQSTSPRTVKAAPPQDPQQPPPVPPTKGDTTGRNTGDNKLKLTPKGIDTDGTQSPTEEMRGELQSGTTGDDNSGSGSDDTVTVTPPTQPPLVAGTRTSSLTNLHDVL